MIGYLMLLLFLTPLAVFTLTSTKKLVLYVLLIGGMPITTFMPDLVLFGFLGGLAPQAAFLFFIVGAMSFAISTSNGLLLRESIRFNFYTAFLTYVLLSLVWSDDFIYGLRFAVKLIAPFLLYMVVVGTIKASGDFGKVEKVLLFSVLIVIFLTVINYISNGAIGGDKVKYKWIASDVLTAPYMSPANFSFYISSIAIFVLGCYFHFKKNKYAVIYLILTAIVYAAFTRISMAGLVVASGICMFLLTRNILFRYVVPMLVIIGFVVMLFTVDKFRDRMFYNPDKFNISEAIEKPELLENNFDTSGRIYLWTSVIERLDNTNVWIGGGIGSVDSLLVKEFSGQRLHSEYLRLYLDLGVIGIFLFLLGIMQIIYKLLKMINDEKTKPYSAIAISSIAYYLVTLFTDNSLNYVTEFGNYVYAFIGLAISSGINLTNASSEGEIIRYKSLEDISNKRVRLRR